MCAGGINSSQFLPSTANWLSPGLVVFGLPGLFSFLAFQTDMSGALRHQKPLNGLGA